MNHQGGVGKCVQGETLKFRLKIPMLAAFGREEREIGRAIGGVAGAGDEGRGIDGRDKAGTVRLRG